MDMCRLKKVVFFYPSVCSIFNNGLIQIIIHKQKSGLAMTLYPSRSFIQLTPKYDEFILSRYLIYSCMIWKGWKIILLSFIEMIVIIRLLAYESSGAWPHSTGQNGWKARSSWSVCASILSPPPSACMFQGLWSRSRGCICAGRITIYPACSSNLF